MIYDEVQKGLDLSGEEGKIDYAFDLNEFFATNEMGQFVHKDEVKRFLTALYTQEKYPFSTDELRTELSHTLWLMDRVNSCKVLYKLLSEDPVFKEYEVVLAAGDGKVDDDDPAENDKAYDRVKDAIAHHDKTITLSVGQLTVGVTIPEWSGVLMLCNLKSASSYMQAAFRAQNPCMMKRNGGFYRKENAYIFDFDPSRTLQIYDEFANNLSRDTVNGGGTLDERKEKVKRLINFFPVIGEDEEGKMIELDAAQVLTIPNKLRSEEVVRHGFMSNFLFQNIGNIFGAPSVVSQILEKMGTADEEKKVKNKEDPLDKKDDIEVDENGNAVPKEEIVIGQTQDLFGPKVYEVMEVETDEAVDDVDTAKTPDEITQKLDDLKDTLINTVKQNVVGKVAEEYELKPTRKKRLETEVTREIERKFDRAKSDFEQTTNVARVERDKRIASATNKAEVESANDEYQKTLDEAMDTLKTAVHETAKDIVIEVDVRAGLLAHPVHTQKHQVTEFGSILQLIDPELPPIHIFFRHGTKRFNSAAVTLHSFGKLADMVQAERTAAYLQMIGIDEAAGVFTLFSVIGGYADFPAIGQTELVVITAVDKSDSVRGFAHMLIEPVLFVAITVQVVFTRGGSETQKIAVLLRIDAETVFFLASLHPGLMVPAAVLRQRGPVAEHSLIFSIGAQTIDDFIKFLLEFVCFEVVSYAKPG